MKRVMCSQKQLEMFSSCGAALWAEIAADKSDIRIVCNCCRSRWCVPCMNVRANRIRSNVQKLLQERPAKFLTLTLRHSNTPLKDQIVRLYACFAELRRRAAWIENVKGGAAFLEVKLSDRDGLWHPHLHCLVEMQWWDQREISSLWHAVTGDSSIVHITPVKNAEHQAAYVTKYVTKPADASVFKVPDKLDEMMVAMRGRRLLNSFGTWRGQKLEAIPDGGLIWTAILPLYSLIANARAGGELEVRYVQALQRKYPNKPWPSWLSAGVEPMPDG